MAGLFDQLIDAFQALPGVGPKTAQRMSLHVLERDRRGAAELSRVLAEAIERIGRCQRCRGFTEDEVCGLCRDSQRDASLLCVVESPADQIAIEQATDFRGYYFVLMGRLSPLDGIGPQELGLDQLGARLADEAVREVVIATNPTVEGEATSQYIATMADRERVRVTRLAQGVPMGGELEYLDRSTLAQAFGSRRNFET